MPGTATANPKKPVDIRAVLFARAGDVPERRTHLQRTLSAVRPRIPIASRYSAAELARLAQLSAGDQGGRSLDAHRIDEAYVGFRYDFLDRLARSRPLYEQLFTVIDDDREVNKQIWISSNPVLRPWIGPRKLYKFRGESKTIETGPHEASVLVPCRDVMNDRAGLYQRRIRSLGDSYDQGIDAKVIAMFVAGVAGSSLGTTYDGQSLIDTDHTALSADAGVAAQQQSNKVTGAFSATVFKTALERYAVMTDEHDNPLMIEPRYLLHGPANMAAVKTVLVQATLASGEENIYARSIIPVMHPRITGTEWALLPERSMSIVIHRKRPPAFKAVDDPNDSWVFDNDMFKYGIDGEFGVDYLSWQEIVGGPGT